MPSPAIKVQFDRRKLQCAIDEHSNVAEVAHQCGINPGTLSYILKQGKGAIEYVMPLIYVLDLADPGAIFDLNGYCYKLNKLSRGNVILSYRVDHRHNGG